MPSGVSYLTLADCDLAKKRVIIREDLNVPLDKTGRITNAERIERALPTLRQAIAAKAKVLVLSHLGRPTAGQPDPAFSLKPVAAALSEALGQSVVLVEDWLSHWDAEPGQLLLAENVRFLVGETENDPQLAQRMGAACDVFVMDAFATAHRAQASTVGIAEYAPTVCAGPLLVEELTALDRALKAPKRPLAAIVGGSKVSTKIALLDALIQQVDQLIVGGGIANTFLAATGVNVGKSLYEPDWVTQAQTLLSTAAKRGVDIPLPTDVVVASTFSADAPAQTKMLTELKDTDMILDVGPETRARYPTLMSRAGTIVWNGPVGVFEFPAFSAGTKALGQAIAGSSAYTLAGGGDTLAALAQFNLTDAIDYVSTGGGAFLSYMEGEPLPAVAVLSKHKQN